MDKIYLVLFCILFGVVGHAIANVSVIPIDDQNVKVVNSTDNSVTNTTLNELLNKAQQSKSTDDIANFRAAQQSIDQWKYNQIRG